MLLDNFFSAKYFQFTIRQVSNYFEMKNGSRRQMEDEMKMDENIEDEQASKVGGSAVGRTTI